MSGVRPAIRGQLHLCGLPPLGVQAVSRERQTMSKSAIRQSRASGSTLNKIRSIVASGWTPQTGVSPSRWIKDNKRTRRSRQEAGVNG